MIDNNLECDKMILCQNVVFKTTSNGNKNSQKQIMILVNRRKICGMGE